MAEVIDETGIELPDMAVSAARVFGLILKADVDVEHPGWANVARYALATFAEGEGGEEVSLSCRQAAVLAHKAFTRAAGDDEGTLPFDVLSPPAQLAWEGVIRHLANVCNFEPEQARQMETHEAQMADMMLARPT